MDFQKNPFKSIFLYTFDAQCFTIKFNPFQLTNHKLNDVENFKVREVSCSTPKFSLFYCTKTFQSKSGKKKKRNGII